MSRLRGGWLTLLLVPTVSGSSALRADPCAEEQRLVASDGDGGDEFGSSVAVAGDIAVVGAIRDDNGVGMDAGAAYVFERIAGAWTETAKLTPENGQDEAYFGTVAVSGGTIVVGSMAEDNLAGENAGAAYVFERVGGTWVQQQKLMPSDAGPWDFFGWSVSISGDSIVVGAERGLPGCCAGSAYVFVRSGGTWTEQQKLVAFDAAEDDSLGMSASISGDSIVLGAPGNDNAAGSDAGAAYVFVRNADTWTLQQKLFVSDGWRDDYLGWSVAIDGEALILGSPGNGASRRIMSGGAAFVFARSGGLWTEAEKLVSSNAVPFEWFGHTVAISDDRAVVGIEGAFGGGGRGGAAVAYRRSAGGWAEEQTFGPWPSLTSVRSVAATDLRLLLGALAEDDPRGVGSGTARLFECAAIPLEECDAGANISQPCDGVQLAGSADGAGGVTTSVRWTSSCPGTVFAPSDDVLDPFVSFGSSCGVSCELTLSVIDDDGQVLCSDALQVEIDDTAAPRIVADAGDRHCVWSPRHAWACYERADFHPVVTDDCGQATWRFIGCASDQPADDIGDGHTDPDCLVSPDGERVCVRAERQGGQPAGRTYTVSIEALDDCGNSSEAAVGIITIPHDRRNHPDCRATPRGGRRLPSR